MDSFHQVFYPMFEKEVLTFSSVLETFLKLFLFIHKKKKHRKNTYFTSFQIAMAVVDVVISSSYSSYETIIWCEVVATLSLVEIFLGSIFFVGFTLFVGVTTSGTTVSGHVNHPL